MKHHVTLKVNRVDVAGELDIQDSYWTFESDAPEFKTFYPYGLTSFMIYGHMNQAKQQIVDEVLLRLEAYKGEDEAAVYR